MELTPLIQKALRKATELHLGQCRKGSELPYIIHPVSVAIILSSYTKDEKVIAAGLLHDVLEDVPDYPYGNLKRDFGKKVADLVKEVTYEDQTVTWQERKQRYIDHLKTASKEALLIAAADKIQNLTSHAEDHLEFGKEMWKKFNASPEKNLWFYEEVIKVLKKRLKGNIIKELESAYCEAKRVILG